MTNRSYTQNNKNSEDAILLETEGTTEITEVKLDPMIVGEVEIKA